MDGLILLRRARDAGLVVAAEDDKLVIRGPKRAEPVALLLIKHKPEVMAALVPAKAALDPQHESSPAWWRRQYLVRTKNWELSGARSEGRAQVIAWGELEDRWHRLHGTRNPQWQCAGCGTLIGGLSALDLADGTRLHLVDSLDCLFSYGERWRREASAGLKALGLLPPPEPRVNITRTPRPT
jgi:hypothetical protein